jgi:CDP-Glycerol:Poly(glycerophosphate) glycerophosphotransferase
MSFFSEYSQVNRLLQQKQQVIFYSESRHYSIYFKKLMDDLLAEPGLSICYITSDKNDPLLEKAPAGMNVLYVKWMLGFLFSRIRADVMIMTMPDLDNFLFKRSPGVGTYVYMFHAAVSTHQQYRKKAFFHYDTVFCTGEYQLQEIREAEKLYGQKQKTVIPYGYPLLDELNSHGSVTAGNDRPTILIAPSWFEGCILDTCIKELLQLLSSPPYKVILRSHPEYAKRKKKEFRKIQQLIARNPAMSMDELPNVFDRLPLADILITDRSGIAFEFAFGMKRPVLFIDTAYKQMNPDWKELGMEPIENSLRSSLGVTISPAELEKLPQKMSELTALQPGFANMMDELRQKIFYNSKEAYRSGLAYVVSKIK